MFRHEGFIDAVTLREKTGIPAQNANLIAGKHTAGERLGELMNIALPKLGVTTITSWTAIRLMLSVDYRIRQRKGRWSWVKI